jgi:hypothetical protein
MKRITILLFVIIAINLQGRSQCTTKYVSQRIDSICKAKSITNCEVYYYTRNGGSDYISSVDHNKVIEGTFRLDDCFFIVNGGAYFDLSKLLNFTFDLKPDNPKKNRLIIHFQSF